MDPHEQLIASRMRSARRLAGLSQEEAAHALEVTVRTYARWESGETGGFLARLDTIAAVLHTSADALAGGHDGVTIADVFREVSDLRQELHVLLANLGVQP